MSGIATAVVASAVVGGVVSSNSASKNADAIKDANQAQIDANKIDPRITDMLFGTSGQLNQGVAPTYGMRADGTYGQTNADSDYAPNTPGLLDYYKQIGMAPQNPGMASFGSSVDDWFKNYGAENLNNTSLAAQRLQGSNIAAPQVDAAHVRAPSQNNLNLAPAYKDMVYGAPGANSFLTGAIQKGINQSSNAFGNYMQDATKATQDLLGNIRGGAIEAGQYGSSRQGIAEGRAIGDMTQNLGRAASQFGQNNTDAAVSAQAGAYDADRNRALAAMSGLGAQQYGVASQNASMDQQARLANAQSQLGTNSLNSSNTQAGIGASSGLLNQAYGYGGSRDMYDLNKAGAMNGLLQPYLSKNPVPTQIQPAYNNSGSAALGGAMAGVGMYNQLSGAFGGTGGNYNSWLGSNAGAMNSQGMTPSMLNSAF
jgi:hypothetical protein